MLSSVPAPTAVTVAPPVGMIIAGSSPSLTCTVELDLAVDVPVNVSTEWSSPDMTIVTPTSSVMETLTRYTVMAGVDTARSGSYTCQASTDSSSQFITGSEKTPGSITITVGEYQLSPSSAFNFPHASFAGSTHCTPCTIKINFIHPSGSL